MLVKFHQELRKEIIMKRKMQNFSALQINHPKINIKNLDDIRYWYKTLNVSEHELRNAIYLVGNDLVKIKQFLNRV